MSDEATLRKHAREIFRAGAIAADATDAVHQKLRVVRSSLIADRRNYPLTQFRNTYVVGAGKAGLAMARAVEEVLGQRITKGWVNIKESSRVLPCPPPLERITLHPAEHPRPGEKGWTGTTQIVDIVKNAQENDLVICVISGGASALMPYGADGVYLEDKQRLNELLLACGASIHEMNTIRKHVSAIKGGLLAQLASPATVISLLLSDVIGDDFNVIGSGPTSPDHSTFHDAKEIAYAYRIWESFIMDPVFWTTQ